MYILITLLISIMANVISHFICKWLEREKSDNYPKKIPGGATPGIFVSTCKLTTLL